MVIWDLSGDIISYIGTQIIIITLLKLGMLLKTCRLYTTCNLTNSIGGFFSLLSLSTNVGINKYNQVVLG